MLRHATGCIALIGALLACAPIGRAQEKKSEKPRITAITPLQVVPGATVTLRVRGLKLNGATELRFAGAAGAMTGKVKEAKAADMPTGLEAKDVGDTQVEASVSVPAELPLGPLSFTVVTPQGDTPPAELQVVNGCDLVEEKEPNGGFREAQPIERGKLVRGSIKEDKDVDVFQVEGRAKERLRAHVTAKSQASLADSVLTLYDAHGNVLASNDDADATNRDASLTAELPSDGKYFIGVTDAHDRGGAWHAYALRVEEAK